MKYLVYIDFWVCGFVVYVDFCLWVCGVSCIPMLISGFVCMFTSICGFVVYVDFYLWVCDVCCIPMLIYGFVVHVDLWV